MAIDMAARLKELREKKALEAKQAENHNAETKEAETQTTSAATTTALQVSESSKEDSSTVPTTTPNTSTTVAVGTARTSEIDHLQFMSNLQELQEAIHTQHPKMPVLLMMIHKHLRTDPELVTTLSEEDIGVIVNGLKIQTKTELTGTVLKQPKSKKTTLSLDMF